MSRTTRYITWSSADRTENDSESEKRIITKLSFIAEHPTKVLKTDASVIRTDELEAYEDIRRLASTEMNLLFLSQFSRPKLNLIRFCFHDGITAIVWGISSVRLTLMNGSIRWYCDGIVSASWVPVLKIVGIILERITCLSTTNLKDWSWWVDRKVT